MAAVDTLIQQIAFEQDFELKEQRNSKQSAVIDSSDNESKSSSDGHPVGSRQQHATLHRPGDHHGAPASPLHFHAVPRRHLAHSKHAAARKRTNMWLQSGSAGAGQAASGQQQQHPQKGAQKISQHAGPLKAGAAGSASMHMVANLGAVQKVPWYQRIHIKEELDRLLPLFHPNHPAKLCWDLFLLLLVLYNAFVVPLDISYGLPAWRELDIAEYTIDGIFFLDLLANFRTAYFNHQGELVRDSGAIAARYMAFWFWVDIFASIPFDALLKIAGVTSGSGVVAMGFLKTPRLLRLGRLIRFTDRFQNAKVLKIFFLFLLMTLLAHWLACIWYGLYRYGGQKIQNEDWAFERGTDEGNKMSYYVISYYNSFLLLVGDNLVSENNLERVFMIVVLLLGTLLYSAVVGHMALLVATLDTNTQRHTQRQLLTANALRYMGAPMRYQGKVQEMFEYLKTRGHPGPEGFDYLRELPPRSYADLHSHLHSRYLRKMKLLAGCEPAFVQALAARMRVVMATPEEVIFREGDVGHEMYIIRKGAVAVISTTNEIRAVLGPSECFGELALITAGKRSASCTSLTFTDLAVLDGSSLRAVMHDFPLSARVLEARALEKIAEMQAKVFVVDDEEHGEDNWWAADGQGHARRMDVAHALRMQGRDVPDPVPSYVAPEEAAEAEGEVLGEESSVSQGSEGGFWEGGADVLQQQGGSPRASPSLLGSDAADRSSAQGPGQQPDRGSGGGGGLPVVREEEEGEGGSDHDDAVVRILGRAATQEMAASTAAVPPFRQGPSPVPVPDPRIAQMLPTVGSPAPGPSQPAQPGPVGEAVEEGQTAAGGPASPSAGHPAQQAQSGGPGAVHAPQHHAHGHGHKVHHATGITWHKRTSLDAGPRSSLDIHHPHSPGAAHKEHPHSPVRSSHQQQQHHQQHHPNSPNKTQHHAQHDAPHVRGPVQPHGHASHAHAHEEEGHSGEPLPQHPWSPQQPPLQPRAGRPVRRTSVTDADGSPVAAHGRMRNGREPPSPRMGAPMPDSQGQGQGQGQAAQDAEQGLLQRSSVASLVAGGERAPMLQSQRSNRLMFGSDSGPGPSPAMPLKPALRRGSTGGFEEAGEDSGPRSTGRHGGPSDSGAAPGHSPAMYSRASMRRGSTGELTVSHAQGQQGQVQQQQQGQGHAQAQSQLGREASLRKGGAKWHRTTSGMSVASNAAVRSLLPQRSSLRHLGATSSRARSGAGSEGRDAAAAAAAAASRVEELEAALRRVTKQRDALVDLFRAMGRELGSLDTCMQTLVDGYAHADQRLEALEFKMMGQHSTHVLTGPVSAAEAKARAAELQAQLPIIPMMGQASSTLGSQARNASSASIARQQSGVGSAGAGQPAGKSSLAKQRIKSAFKAAALAARLRPGGSASQLSGSQVPSGSQLDIPSEEYLTQARMSQTSEIQPSEASTLSQGPAPRLSGSQLSLGLQQQGMPSRLSSTSQAVLPV